MYENRVQLLRPLLYFILQTSCTNIRRLFRQFSPKQNYFLLQDCANEPDTLPTCDITHVKHIEVIMPERRISTKWLIYRRLNSYVSLIWQICIINVNTPKFNWLYFCVDQQQHYALLAWCTSHYFILLHQICPIMRTCWCALLAFINVDECDIMIVVFPFNKCLLLIITLKFPCLLIAVF